MTDELVRQLVQRAQSKVRSDRIVTADEVAEWPDGAFDALLREGILQEIQPATTVECDACFERHAEVVEFVEEPPGSALRAYIACPEFGRVKVDTQRMRRWEITATVQRRTLPGSLTRFASGRNQRGAHRRRRFRHSRLLARLTTSRTISTPCQADKPRLSSSSDG